MFMLCYVDNFFGEVYSLISWSFINILNVSNFFNLNIIMVYSDEDDKISEQQKQQQSEQFNRLIENRNCIDFRLN